MTILRALRTFAALISGRLTPAELEHEEAMQAARTRTVEWLAADRSAKADAHAAKMAVLTAKRDASRARLAAMLAA